MRKVIALIMATLMVVAMAFSAFAVSITINADPTFKSGTSGSETGALYTWYRVFTAKMDPSGTTSGTGGSGSFWYNSGTGYNSGMDASSFEKVAYTASLAVAQKLGTYDSATNTWTANSNQPWFILTPIAGTNPQTFSVKWNEAQNDKTGASIRAAAQYLYDGKIWDETGSFEYSDSDHCWTADNLVAGYYVVDSAVGKNLIAATSDININEKNVYPSLDKKQADEDSGTMSDDDRNVAIGDTLNYEIRVTVPATIKEDDILKVWDKATIGLDFVAGSLKVMVGEENVTTAWTDEDIVEGQTWGKTITITATNLSTYAGKEVVFTFNMKVNDKAVIDTGKENEAGLKFGDDSGTYFETLPDEVKYKTYYTGIEKKDGKTMDALDGVQFKLQVMSGTEGIFIPVTRSGSYYYPTSGTEYILTTGEGGTSGTIIIRGLDDDKKYELVEVATLDGYNMLSGTVKLKLVEDKSGTVPTATGTYQEVLNFSGTVLPSTGGIGTTIFYIVGGLLAVGAGVVLVAKKRMGKVED